MKRIAVMGIILLLLSVLVIETVPIMEVEAPETGSVTGVAVEVQNTTRNQTALERYRHTIVVAQLAGTGDLSGYTIYLNITGAIVIHSTGITDLNGTVMWEWIPENLSTVYINASYNQTTYDNVTRVVYEETDVMTDLEHPQKVEMGHEYYFQLFAISKVSYFEPSLAPYRIRIYRHNPNNTHTALTEWVGFLDNHGYRGFYVDISETLYDPGLNYEVWVYLYNHTGNASEGQDTLIDSDGGTTQTRGATFEAGTYLSFYDVYGPSSSLWWYSDAELNNNNYDVIDANNEALNWTHTVYGTIALVGPTAVHPCPDKLSSANNYKNIYFNDSNGNEQWDNDTDGEGAGTVSEDIWLDDGNGIWNDNETQQGYPYEEYNGTPFLLEFHSFKVDYGLGTTTTTLRQNKWTWTSYLNATVKTGKSLYENLTNCSYVVMQNSTGYYNTYGPGITENFNINFGSAVCILCTSDEAWDQR